MSTFDDETVEAFRLLPPELVEDVIQELAEQYERGDRGATLLVQAAGQGDHHVRRFDQPDSYRHSKGHPKGRHSKG